MRRDGRQDAPIFHDDPARDYRLRYRLPDQFVWDEAAWPRIDFDGYMEMAIELLPPAPVRVLDVGCGPGAGAARLVQRGYEVTGVDFNERAIAFGRLMVAGATFLAGDIRDLAHVDGLGEGYDAAWCVEVLEHVPPADRSAVFEGIAALLRPGGVLVLTTPSPLMHTNAWDYRRADLRELREAMAAAGLHTTEVRYQHRMTSWFSRGAWRLLTNGVYDLRAVRRLMRRLFLRRWNVVTDPGRAGRFVIRAERDPS
jgi:2-polyprenyl-3-methyl-5-hydroxy-6-metoxy-1,4-benzoquinol methylase